MAQSEWMQDPGWKFLRQSDEEKLQEQATRKFDNKTHTWIPDPEEGFLIAAIAVDETDSLSVTLPNGTQKKYTRDQCQEINPAKFEKTEDMSNLTMLNEASVLHNLRQRYRNMMIYTYSGLFCVFVNPYKMLPIYTDSVAKMYVNRRRSEMPPHLFAVADEAFRNMISEHENQSMLITGESGAGKTENTKKVISYFAMIGAGGQAVGGGGQASEIDTKKKSENSLENQIVQANPAIEAFGNGATVRNYNSSRFGKFIRIHFDKRGKLVGGDIEHYLLEKSRVIKQAPGERSYHIFYQMMTQKKLRDRFSLTDNIRDYNFVSQAEITVPCMDDKEEFKATNTAFDVMGFSDFEKDELYKTCAAIMFMGNMKFKQKPRDEQAEIDGMDAPEKAARLLGVNVDLFIHALCAPKIKVGNEWVTKAQNVQQVDWGVGALSKAIYARVFTWLINRCNETLTGHLEDAAHYIGVLDIAGFEIFNRNSFEQLWINFVNEKLQQFFNHHMFVLEQEEYRREGIEWTFIDFGLDLQACIELIEKPLGIISMLDEECIVPKATDMTYVDKLTNQHLGKHPNFVKAKPPKGKEAHAHFAIVHYAGTVRYNAEQWLDKNKDPLNDSAVACLKAGGNPEALVCKIWSDYMTDVDREAAAARGKTETGGKKKGKSASFMTVSTMYRESLNSLMTMLHTTHPHFIRCIIPNEKKTSGLIEAPLVLNQLTCNGVLEGIRICRKGFPNRMCYDEFRYRYAILAADEANDKDTKVASIKMLDKMLKTQLLIADHFRSGATKVFFRAGVLARLEEARDEAIAKFILYFQAAIRARLALDDYASKIQQIDAAGIIQENVRSWVVVRKWPWFRLYAKLKPLLKGMKSNAEIEALEKRCKEIEAAHKIEEETRKRLEDELRAKKEECADTQAALDRERAAIERRNKEIEELNASLRKEQEKLEEADKKQKDLEKQRERERKEAEEKERKLGAELEQEKNRAQAEAEVYKEKLKTAEEAAQKGERTRKAQEKELTDMANQLEAARQKNDRQENERNKLAEQLEKAENEAIVERKQRDEMQKANKKLEAQLRAMKEQMELMQKDRSNSDVDLKRRDEEISILKSKALSDANLIAKLQSTLRALIARIEELEEDLDAQSRARNRIEKHRNELQAQLDSINEQCTEAKGQLTAQVHLNNTRATEMAELHREIERKSLTHEAYVADLCSMQYLTISQLRNLSQQAATIENEASQLLDIRRAQTLGGALTRDNTVTIYDENGSHL
ncbi:unnamed protein product, partial [Mesorhabditis belari]|uniref:Myosin heavy chain n=1 Tax=Mesorhabditis belari TaxID=2138241 RepID=A0AAF3E9N7_9BILA